MPQNKPQIIKKPWITEKSTRLAQEGKYVFLVPREAQSKQIGESLERIYGIHVVKVNVMNIPGRGGEYKKAIVTLKEGEKIDIVPQ